MREKADRYCPWDPYRRRAQAWQRRPRVRDQLRPGQGQEIQVSARLVAPRTPECACRRQGPESGVRDALLKAVKPPEAKEVEAAMTTEDGRHPGLPEGGGACSGRLAGAFESRPPVDEGPIRKPYDTE